MECCAIIYLCCYKSEVQREVKEKIHPQYHDTKVVCACGSSFVTGSVQKDLKVDVCSKCHPFFTGQQRNMAARGRIEQFNKRFGAEAK